MKPSTSNSSKVQQCLVEEPAANTGQLSPDIVGVGHVGNIQEVLQPFSDSTFPEPTIEYQGEIPNDTHNLIHLLCHLGHLDFQQPHCKFTCLDGHDPSSEVQNLTSALLGLSTSAGPGSSDPLTVRTTPSARSTTPSTLSILNHGLAANVTTIGTTSTNSNPRFPLVIRTVPSSISGMSGQISPVKKKYYGIVVGKCTGIYYDKWDNILPLVKHVPDACYQGFSSHEAVQEYYLSVKALNKVRFVQNPGDNEIYGPRDEAVQ